MLRIINKTYILILLLLVIAVAGIFFFSKNQIFKSTKAENATVVLEKIKTVTKLISVEGQFSELYNYKESYDYDFFNLFSKKIILRVNAKVSVGYNFEKINFSIDSINKIVTLNELPHAEILSIDHDLDYYDISEGTFNKFSTDEYNMIQRKAKEMVRSKAQNTSLLDIAEKEKSDFLKMLEMALQSAGWTLTIKGNSQHLQ